MMTTNEVAELLGVAPKTIQRWRKEGKGPPFYKISEHVIRYKRKEVLEWLRKKERKE